MVEQSVKNAIEPFVFAANDSNTWTRVKAMISNYLTEQWKQGALAGTTAKDAFYVNVGLGVTMSDLDIWEGRMIVQIGMAVVRPAEFIILQFLQMMQTS
jgi:phage tail sheath protein FI